MASMRTLVASMLAVAVPASVIGADRPAAMVCSSGRAWITGSMVPKSSALFAGDLLQTDPDVLAKITTLGSKVVVSPGSLLEVQNDTLRLKRGGLNVTTFRRMAVQAGALRIAPASVGLTVFRVTEAEGFIRIEAQTGDLALSDGTTLRQGQEARREESPAQSKKRRGKGPAPPAKDGALNSAVAIGSAAGIGGAGVTSWVLFGNSDDPLSPAKP